MSPQVALVRAHVCTHVCTGLGSIISGELICPHRSGKATTWGDAGAPACNLGALPLLHSGVGEGDELGHNARAAVGVLDVVAADLHRGHHLHGADRHSNSEASPVISGAPVRQLVVEVVEVLVVAHHHPSRAGHHRGMACLWAGTCSEPAGATLGVHGADVAGVEQHGLVRLRAAAHHHVVVDLRVVAHRVVGDRRAILWTSAVG